MYASIRTAGHVELDRCLSRVASQLAGVHGTIAWPRGLRRWGGGWRSEVAHVSCFVLQTPVASAERGNTHKQSDALAHVPCFLVSMRLTRPGGTSNSPSSSTSIARKMPNAHASTAIALTAESIAQLRALYGAATGA